MVSEQGFPPLVFSTRSCRRIWLCCFYSHPVLFFSFIFQGLFTDLFSLKSQFYWVCAHDNSKIPDDLNLLFFFCPDFICDASFSLLVPFLEPGILCLKVRISLLLIFLVSSTTASVTFSLYWKFRCNKISLTLFCG